MAVRSAVDATDQASQHQREKRLHGSQENRDGLVRYPARPRVCHIAGLGALGADADPVPGAVTPDGSVLVVGGSDGCSVLGSADAFDPVSQRFRTVGGLRQPRFGHKATALPDGRVLITGGALINLQALSPQQRKKRWSRWTLRVDEIGEQGRRYRPGLVWARGVEHIPSSEDASPLGNIHSR